MRRTAALLALAAGLLAVPAAGTAVACAPPAEGEPTQCCPPRELTRVTVGDQTVVVYDPTDRPRLWCS